MAWQLERKRRLWKPWEWELVFSSIGMSWGTAWTKRGAENAMLKEQGRMFAED